MSWVERDQALRAAAFAKVVKLQARFGSEIPARELSAGFSFQDQMIPLTSRAEGIYHPAGHVATVSIKTTVPRKGRVNPYEDQLLPGSETFRYAYKAHGGGDNHSNRSLRVAMAKRLPLVYFWALAPGIYAAVLPVFVVHDDQFRREFHVVPGDTLNTHERNDDVGALLCAKPDRRYALGMVKQRLHQRSFRRLVLTAYQHRCAMCSIRFDEFLEAAHIVQDRYESGWPSVRNGLSLCSLHHQAFDRHLVDVDEDLRIRVSDDLPHRRDGPIFKAAFLQRHGQRLHLPQDPACIRPPSAWRSEDACSRGAEGLRTRDFPPFAAFYSGLRSSTPEQPQPPNSQRHTAWLQYDPSSQRGAWPDRV